MTKKYDDGRDESGMINGLHYKIPSCLNRKKVKVESLEVKLIVIKAEDLAIKDHFLKFIPTKSDPYCMVRFMPEGPKNTTDESVIFLGKTTVKHTVNPVWNEVFSASVQMNFVSENACFRLRLFDKDEDSKDDPMGDVFIPIHVKELSNTSKREAVEEDHATYEHTDWYDVQETVNGEEATGRVQCTVKLAQTTQYVTISNEPSSSGEPLYFLLKLRIIKAQGLAKKDTNFLGMKTSSDPYVIVRLMVPGDPNGVLIGTTEYVQHTTNPTWNEVLSKRVQIDELDPKTTFRLKLMDRDDHTSDDLMGIVHIPIEEVLKKVNSKNLSATTTQWYQVPPDSAEDATGKVQCKLTISLLLPGQKNSP